LWVHSSCISAVGPSRHSCCDEVLLAPCAPGDPTTVRALREVVRSPRAGYLSRSIRVTTASAPMADNGEAASDEPEQQAMPAGEEDTPEPFRPREARRGVWEGADAFHFAEGDALIIEVAPGRYVLRVENFSVRNGPDLFMYLSPDPDGYAEGGLTLGELRATDGSFNYEIPEGTDLSLFKSVVVWCERFAVLFATATLEYGAGQVDPE